ncbi:MAG: Lrp/AsnC family transcriptional regulator [Microbacterium sp.]
MRAPDLQPGTPFLSMIGLEPLTGHHKQKCCMVLLKFAFLMQDLCMIDPADFALVNAIQISPRASWAELAPILRVDASTLSRRWRRLVSARLVWTSCTYAEPEPRREAPRRTRMAIVEVACKPGQRESAIAALGEIGAVSSVHCTSGSRDLYLTVAAPTLRELDRLVDGIGDHVPGITGTRTHHLRRIFQEGSSWRLGALRREEADAVALTRPSVSSRVEPSSLHFQLLDALGEDARLPVSDLQTRLGRSSVTVARAVNEMLSADWARWRVDFAHEEGGWDASAMLWISVDQTELEKVAAALCMTPQVRLCASIAGQANLTASLWLRDIAELDEIEAKLTRVFRRLRIVDRWITPRVAKRVGHVLDADGRWMRFVRPEVTVATWS